MATPTPNLLDPDAISRAEALGLHARYVVEGYMAGEHKSPYRGFAIEFAQHREYTPGDDLRHQIRLSVSIRIIQAIVARYGVVRTDTVREWTGSQQTVTIDIEELHCLIVIEIVQPRAKMDAELAGIIRIVVEIQLQKSQATCSLKAIQCHRGIDIQARGISVDEEAKLAMQTKSEFQLERNVRSQRSCSLQLQSQGIQTDVARQIEIK